MPSRPAAQGRRRQRGAIDGRDWKRLGEQLRLRRIHLGFEYMTAFAETTGLLYKTTGELETGYRTNYTPAQLVKAAGAYQVTYASIGNVLDHGGDLVPLEAIGRRRTPRRPRGNQGAPELPVLQPAAEQPAADLSRFSPEMRDRMEPHLAAIAVRMESARRARAVSGLDPEAVLSGAEVFGPGEDATSWDNLARRVPPSMHDLLPVMLAELLALEELRDNQQQQDDEAPGEALHRE